MPKPPPEPPPPEPVPVPPTEQVAEVQDVPIPPQKPEPPKKKEVKKKDEKKPVNDEQFLDSLVDKLAKEQTAAVPPTTKKRPPTSRRPKAFPSACRPAKRMRYGTISRDCWFSARGRRIGERTRVTLEIKLNPDATLRNVEISRKDRARMGDPVFRSFAESAKRAVDKCGADRQPFPLNLQRDYAVWGYILARFRELRFLLRDLHTEFGEETADDENKKPHSRELY